ncbi:hypothetical protein Tco_1548143 [Tanacetum coccineum]
MGNMEMEPDIENITMSEYLEYEATKERRLWDDVRSRRSPTHYDEADFSFSHRNKINTFYYPYSHDMPASPVQSYPKNILVSTKEEDEDVIQPLIPKTLHTIPPNEDYVASVTKSILDELLEEFGNEILNITMVDEGANFNPNEDIEELEKLLANYPKPHYMEIQQMSIPERCSSANFTHIDPSEGGPNYLVNKGGSQPRDLKHKNQRLHGRHFKFGLVRYHVEDDDGKFVIMDVARRSRLGAWLRACYLFIIPSKSRGVFRSNSTLIS